MRKEIPMAITLISGLVYAIAFYFNLPIAVTLKGTMDKWFLITTAFTCLVGVVNLTRVHASRAFAVKRVNWHRSAILMISMYGMMLVGILGGHTGPAFKFLYNNIMSPLYSSVMGLLVFYLGSASYRAFRAKNPESIILLVTGIIVMLGQAPIGAMISKYLPIGSSWLLNVPNVAGMRGIIIGSSLGAVAQAFRVLVGIERQQFGSGS